MSTEHTFGDLEGIRRDPNGRVHLAQEIRTAFERGYDRGLNDGRRMASQLEAVVNDATRPCCNCQGPDQRRGDDVCQCGCFCHDREKARR